MSRHNILKSHVIVFLYIAMESVTKVIPELSKNDLICFTKVFIELRLDK